MFFPITFPETFHSILKTLKTLNLKDFKLHSATLPVLKTTSCCQTVQLK